MQNKNPFNGEARLTHFAFGHVDNFRKGMQAGEEQYQRDLKVREEQSRVYMERVQRVKTGRQRLINGLDKRIAHIGKGKTAENTKETYQRISRELTQEYEAKKIEMVQQANRRHLLLDDLENILRKYEGQMGDTDKIVHKIVDTYKNRTDASLEDYNGMKEAVFADQAVEAAKARLKEAEEAWEAAQKAVAEAKKDPAINIRDITRLENRAKNTKKAAKTAKEDADKADALAETEEKKVGDALKVIEEAGEVEKQLKYSKEELVELTKVKDDAEKERDDAKDSKIDNEKPINDKATTDTTRITTNMNVKVTARTAKAAADVAAIDATLPALVQATQATAINAQAASDVLDIKEPFEKGLEAVVATKTQKLKVIADDITAKEKAFTDAEAAVTATQTLVSDLEKKLEDPAVLAKRRLKARKAKAEKTTKKATDLRKEADTLRATAAEKQAAAEDAAKLLEAAQAKKTVAEQKLAEAREERDAAKEAKTEAVTARKKVKLKPTPKQIKEFEDRAKLTVEQINREGRYLRRHFETGSKERIHALLNQKTTILLDKISGKKATTVDMRRFLVAARNENRYLQRRAGDNVARIKALNKLDIDWSKKLLAAYKAETTSTLLGGVKVAPAGDKENLDKQWSAIQQELEELKEEPGKNAARIALLYNVDPKSPAKRGLLQKVLDNYHKKYLTKTEEQWMVAMEDGASKRELQKALDSIVAESTFLKRNDHNMVRLGELRTRKSELMMRLRGERSADLNAALLNAESTSDRIGAIEGILEERGKLKSEGAYTDVQKADIEAEIQTQLAALAKNTDRTVNESLKSTANPDQIFNAMDMIMNEGAFLQNRFLTVQKARISQLKVQLRNVADAFIKKGHEKINTAASPADLKDAKNLRERIRERIYSNGYLRPLYHAKLVGLLNIGKKDPGLRLMSGVEKAEKRAQKGGSKAELEQAKAYIEAAMSFYPRGELRYAELDQSLQAVKEKLGKVKKEEKFDSALELVNLKQNLDDRAELLKFSVKKESFALLKKRSERGPRISWLLQERGELKGYLEQPLSKKDKNTVKVQLVTIDTLLTRFRTPKEQKEAYKEDMNDLVGKMKKEVQTLQDAIDARSKSDLNKALKNIVANAANAPSAKSVSAKLGADNPVTAQFKKAEKALSRQVDSSKKLLRLL